MRLQSDGPLARRRAARGIALDAPPRLLAKAGAAALHLDHPLLGRGRRHEAQPPGGGGRRRGVEGGDAAVGRFGRASGTHRSLAWGASQLDGSFRVRIAARRLGSQPQGARGGGRAVAPPRGAVRPRGHRRHVARPAGEHVLQLHPLALDRHHPPRKTLPRRALLPLEARAHGREHDAQLARREVLVVGHHTEGHVPHVAPRRRLDGAPGASQPRLVRVSARARRRRWGRRRHGEWEC